MREAKEYALYKGEKLLGMGTIRELAERFNVKTTTLYYYRTPTYLRRTSNEHGRRLVVL
nr:MAG TPA: Putative TetR-family transcriptional regulator [Caudoviricetes sp.]